MDTAGLAEVKQSPLSTGEGPFESPSGAPTNLGRRQDQKRVDPRCSRNRREQGRRVMGVGDPSIESGDGVRFDELASD